MTVFLSVRTLAPSDAGVKVCCFLSSELLSIECKIIIILPYDKIFYIYMLSDIGNFDLDLAVENVTNIIIQIY